MRNARTSLCRAAALGLMLVGPASGAEEPESAHAIWGIGGTAGGFVYEAPLTMPLLGLEVAVGSQVNRRVGVLGTLGLSAGMSHWDLDTQLAALLRPGFLVELTFSERFFGAAGAALMLGWWGDGNSDRFESMVAGPFGGALDLRVGMRLGGSGATPGKKRQLTIGLDVMVLLAPSSVLGGQVVDGHLRFNYRSRLGVGVAPSLMVGYDVR